MCLYCHNPHASKSDKLIVSEGICYTCHDKERFSGMKVVHAPVEAEMCESCHNPHASYAPKLLYPDMPLLCMKCHNRRDFTKRGRHGPVEIGMCMSCHRPHQSNEEKLLTETVPSLCFDCHRRSGFIKENVHPPVQAGQCMECHNSHSSRNRSLLKKDNNDVCLECHPNVESEPHGGIAGGHKLKGRKDPRRRRKPFTCTSCHDPHSSSWIMLFRYKASMSFELCDHCHKKAK
jgi:predicted CXXCH cytochrome family protein